MFLNQKTKYIIRIDDACPTMNKEKWGLFEKYLNIKPIVAVIPNNEDEKMMSQMIAFGTLFALGKTKVGTSWL